MIFRLLILIILAPSILFADIVRPSTVHEVFLKGTDYELHVFRIYGKKPGNKGLIVGGIQGDEPGGYLSADMYVDTVLEKGDLIIIPRANFKSIILFNRGADGDMNRRFIDKKTQHLMDDVVDIIKKLMGEVDFFLHLHDGSGFYNPKYINPLRNPNRWGQSIIVDADKYVCGNNIINLKEIALNIIKKTNEKIENRQYHFQYFNTDTDNPNTKYKDMKKTATYYALKNFCIPSFGLETSKNLPNNETKLLHKKYLIDNFLEHFDIVKSNHFEIFLPKPILNYIIISLDNETRIVQDKEIVNVKANQVLKINNISSNYKRGLSCDILWFNGLNDGGIEYVIKNDTEIICRKDNFKIATITLKINREKLAGVNTNNKFLIHLNNEEKYIDNGETITVKYGSVLKLINFNGNSNIPINLRGFVPPNAKFNDGDDKNIDIKIDNKTLIKRFAVEKNSNKYEVIAGTLNNILGRFYLIIDNN
ncbi:MAG: hypothetical protein K6348_03990 [Deferribacterales bacterium]